MKILNKQLKTFLVFMNQKLIRKKKMPIYWDHILKMIFSCHFSINRLLGDLSGTKNLIKILKRTKNTAKGLMIKPKLKNKFGLKSRKVLLKKKIFNTSRKKNLKISIKLQKLKRKKKNTSKKKILDQMMMKIILNISKN